MVKQRLFIFVVLLCTIISVSSQTTLPVPYFCGFEDPVENANWHTITSTDNAWVVGGTLEAFDGKHSAYVAYANGANKGTSNNPGYYSLYREMTLEAGVEYEISFDWKNPGIGVSELYVLFIDESAKKADGTPLGDADFSAATFDEPKWINDWLVPLDNYTVLTSSPVWQNVVFSVMGNGRKKRLLFFARNKRTSTHVKSGRQFSAACIDNVQIAKKLACARPTDVDYYQIDASSGYFSWAEDLGPFELKYKGVSDTRWNVLTNIDYTLYFDPVLRKYKVPILPLLKGGYIAKVRQICEPAPGSEGVADTSIWTTINLLVHYSSNSCIDFLDLNGPNTSCYIGDTDVTPYNSGPIPPVDRGFASEYSRHTVHYVAEEYDPRTEYNLLTTYEGLPTVRLGNWLAEGKEGSKIGAAEAITYTFPVTADAPLLLVNYALVLQAPTDHDPSEQPMFNLVVANSNGDVQEDMVCGQKNFFADESYVDEDTTWHLGPLDLNNAYVIYKDWSSAGLNLSNYIGQDVRISFETNDCTRPGHFGYAYFALDCMGAKITGIGCGDQLSGVIEAPKGFEYKWYPRSLVDELTPEDSAQVLQEYFDDPAFDDTDRTFTPPGGISDDGIYVCRIIAQDAPDCWFELQADLDPRDVFAKAAATVDYKDCQAALNVDNSSYTKTRTRGDIGRCDFFQWYLDEQRVSNQEDLTLPTITPGTHTIKLEASISDGLCSGIWDTTITVLPYGATTDTIHVRRCTKDPNYTFVDGVTYSTTGIRSHTITGFAGCDSTIVLDMVVASEVGIELTDTIDEDHTPYHFFDQSLYETGTYSATRYGQNGECDTLYTLHLNVWPVLHVDFNKDSLPYACHGDESVSYPYTVNSGTLESFSLTFSQPALDLGFEDQIDVAVSTAAGVITVPIPAGAIPNSYPATIEFDGDTTGTETFRFNVEVYYNAEKTLTQKWNDVIAVYNAENNGGFDFSRFEWYVDGVVIPGAVTSYLYTEDATLQFGARYQARLKRVTDGVEQFTCPFVPEDRSGMTVSQYPVITMSPTQAPPLARVVVELPADVDGSVTIFDVLGKIYGTQRISSADPTFVLPDHTGIYLVRIVLDNGATHSEKVLVR